MYLTQKQESEADAKAAISAEIADEIRMLFIDGFAGKNVRLPRLRWFSSKHAFPDGSVVDFGEDRIVYETPFAEAMALVLDADVVMSALLAAHRLYVPSCAIAASERFRQECAEEYVRQFADDIAEVMYEQARREAEE